MRPTSVTVFAICNFVLGGGCGLLLLLMVATAAFGFIGSGDPLEDIVAGVVGALFLGGIFALGATLYLVAAVGLLKRAKWGYYAHLAAAVATAASCVGVVYTVVALVICLQDSFKQHFFEEERILAHFS